ncbi:deoxyguanosinetriphosphate triphosphohydrolase [Limisalsivibrio acetivorans]|uniref:deoxyguanosinetriphosphate triphosphohydrolase n=1 Tax=Limisalsivibrio acetivorans TaxID=1304888 RepID=UPI0003B315F6|nr:deoxyguanosinetriphosphate triphosphohydrolase [Limisalsivibrio acetivorans]
MDISDLFSLHRLTYSGGITLEEKENNASEFRSDFLRDHDRIIYSNPFRRLSKKTQVHPLSQNDHVHNRLTHSLETATVGRSLGYRFGKWLIDNDPDFPYYPHDTASIIQTACLAHDIGNPPFGHAGEEAIKNWFKERIESTPDLFEELSDEQRNDFTRIDGNAQSFRIVSQLENYPFEGGMRLTATSYAAMIKYPWDSGHPTAIEKDKFCFYQGDLDIARLIFEHFGLYKNGVFKRHPLSYLTEVSDDICYALLDLQDAVELKLIRIEDVKHIFRDICGEERLKNVLDNSKLNDAKKVGHLCGIAINDLTLHAFDVFIDCLENERFQKDLVSSFTREGFKEGLVEAKRFAAKNIYTEKRKLEIEIGSFLVIETLLEEFITAAHAFHTSKNPGSKTERLLKMMDECRMEQNSTLYSKYQRVLDYIIGMTDNYATYIAGQLRGIHF